VSEPSSLTGLTEQQRAVAMRRFAILRPHLEAGVLLTVAAQEGGVPLRTAQRWLACYQAEGLVGLAPKRRSDRGTRRLPEELVTLIEGLALRRPKPSTAWVHRQAVQVARRESWPEPSYSTVQAIVAALDPALVTLAHEGQRAYQEAFELLHRHQAERSNALWQADHTRLDLILAGGERPWLTAILEDYSRAAPGYSLALADPSALHTALALRQAIWRKPDPGWQVCGIPEILYVDHGSDFTSRHVEQVAADLHIRLVHSAPGQLAVGAKSNGCSARSISC
jgi:putative transposase